MYAPCNNCPNASSKRDQRENVWIHFKNRGVLRAKYFAYINEDALETDSRDTLNELYELYNPSSQPRTWAEILYFKVLSDLFHEKLVSSYLDCINS